MYNFLEGSYELSTFGVWMSFCKSVLVWGPLPLRTDTLASMTNIRDALLNLAENTSDENWSVVAIVIWALWRCRNDRAYAAKEAKFEQFIHYHKVISLETMLSKKRLESAVPVPLDPCTVTLADPTRYRCQVDGSWTHNWEG